MMGRKSLSSIGKLGLAMLRVAEKENGDMISIEKNIWIKIANVCIKNDIETQMELEEIKRALDFEGCRHKNSNSCAKECFDHMHTVAEASEEKEEKDRWKDCQTKL